MKLCSKCRKNKNLNLFYKSANTKDGLDYYCKICRKFDRKMRWPKIYGKIKKEMCAYQKKYRKANHSLVRQRERQYYLDNKEIISKKQKIYREKTKNNPERKKRIYLYQKNRLRSDGYFRFTRAIRSRIKQALIKKAKKTYKTEILLGATVSFVRDFLEKKFLSGMSWKNYGKWHIDHIIPCSAFDLSKTEEQKKCFHYTNLQPLWAVDNLKKGAKYVQT